MGFFDFFSTNQPPLVEQALEDLKAMLETAHEMFVEATAHLLDNDALSTDLEARDETINEKEQAIRRAVLEHVTIDPERAMVFSLSILSIVQDAERCGDLAKSIAETARLARGPRMGERVAHLRTLRDRVETMFDITRRAFVESDEALGREVMTTSDETKSRLLAFIKGLAEDDDVSANEALVLGLAARYIGRTGSHLSNIASAVALPFHQIRGRDESI